MIDYSWNFDLLWRYSPALWRGAQVTLHLTIVTVVLGTVLGVVVGLGMRHPSPVVRYPLTFAVDVVRSLPVLILILWIYYLVPELLGRPKMGSFTLAAIALVLNLTAFVADVVRAAVGGVPAGLVHAAYACGLSKSETMWRIILPTVFREILPTFGLLYIDMLKLTSLASIIAVPELLHTADRIRSVTFRPLEVFTLLAGIYLITVMPFSAGVRLLEHTKYFTRRKT